MTRPGKYDVIQIRGDSRLFFKLTPGGVWVDKLADGTYRRMFFILGGGSGKSLSAADVAAFLLENCAYIQALIALKMLGWEDVIVEIYVSDHGGENTVTT